MARDSRRNTRSGVAPGRGKPRPRATSRSSVSKATSTTRTEATQSAGLAVPTLRRGIGITRRAIALLVVLALLAVSYAGSLRIYWGQQHDIAMYQQQINDHNAQVASLQDRLDRWGDDDYVKTQARTRLGWVMPGETGYVVLGPDNRPVQGSGQLSNEQRTASNANMTWWQKLWDSIVTADQPAAPPPSGAPKTPIGDPSPSPTPTKR